MGTPTWGTHSQHTLATMLAAASRTVVARSAVAGSARAFSTTPVASATLREIESRVKSVKNIEKITKSMKMIATTRLNKAQAAMKTAKEYGAANVTVFKESEIEADAASGKKTLWIVISSDRRLCGGIHSSVSKRAKKELQNEANGEDLSSVPNDIVLSFNQIGRQVPSFTDACAMAEQIEELKVEYDNVKIIYNKFVSSIAYESAIMEVHNAAALKASPKFAAYEIEDDALISDLANFALPNAIYAALVEGHAAEICARRNAMDGASKNAGEMISKLQMQFNRMRQASITNELVDIITGASAL